MEKFSKKIIAVILLTVLVITTSAFLTFNEEKSNEEKTIKISQFDRGFYNIPIYVAQNKSYFKDQGLNVELISSAGSGNDIRLLLTKDVDFAATPLINVLKANAKNANLIIVGDIFDKTNLDVVIRKEIFEERKINLNDSPENKLMALKGLKIGISEPGSFSYIVTEYYLKKANLTPGVDVSLVKLGSRDARMAAFESGEIDVLFIGYDIANKEVVENKGIILIDDAKGEIPEFTGCPQIVLVTRSDFAKDNKLLIEKMNQAMSQANEFIINNPDETKSILKETYWPELNSTIYNKALDDFILGVPKDNYISEEKVDNLQDLLIECGYLEHRTPSENFVYEGIRK